jgi:quinoprotein glucose dehydrogenase
MGYGDFANRGVSAWTGSKAGLKLFLATIDARLISIDAASGKATKGFGDNGIVNLRAGLRIPVPENRFADYEETSPPAIAGNTVIVGSGIADNNRADEPSGEVRGYDAATGKLKWTWDPMPQHPKTGAANAWSVIAADPARKLVFVPTGSASPDYYGGELLGRQPLGQFPRGVERRDG